MPSTFSKVTVPPLPAADRQKPLRNVAKGSGRTDVADSFPLGEGRVGDNRGVPSPRRALRLVRRALSDSVRACRPHDQPPSS